MLEIESRSSRHDRKKPPAPDILACRIRKADEIRYIVTLPRVQYIYEMMRDSGLHIWVSLCRPNVQTSIDLNGVSIDDFANARKTIAQQLCLTNRCGSKEKYYVPFGFRAHVAFGITLQAWSTRLRR